jgi:hexosaminidase
MKNFKVKSIFCLIVGVITMTGIYALCQANPKTISIVPKPVMLKQTKAADFILNPDTVIIADKTLRQKAKQLANMIEPATGFDLTIKQQDLFASRSMILKLDSALSRLGDEGYQLIVWPKKVTISAYKEAGLFYGFQTLRQLLPPEIFREAKVEDLAWTIPAVSIEDYPRFEWRGMHLDVCRHFMPKEFIKKYIDLLALHKMNRFHWHLTEDQGWRIEIKKYPKLTEVGAWRKETLVGHYRDKPHKFDGKRHGGFYSQEDVREIVAYAAARHITVIPEIEMPGHAQAAIAAYPELGNTDKQLPVMTIWGVNPNIFNANEETIIFLQNVLEEVLELFPSEFIHIGGDEAPKKQWEGSPDAQARIKKLGLKDEHELQSYFIKRMDTFLTEKGRRLIGWDEILEGGLAPGATVMSWRGEKGGITAAKAGHDVVMAPTTYTYFDYYQADAKNEPLAIGGHLPLRNVYNYNPIPPSLNPEEAKHILGAQGQVWTEYIPTPKKAEYMAFPRACALSEVVWTKQEQKDYKDFLERMSGHTKRLDILDVNYRKLDPEPVVLGSWKSGQTSEEYQLMTFDISGHLKEPAQYQIKFAYTGGSHRLDVEWLEILENEQVIARDAHFGRTGGQNVDNVYSVAISKIKPDAKYTLKARVRSDGGKDSNGQILLESKTKI